MNVCCYGKKFIVYKKVRHSHIVHQGLYCKYKLVLVQIIHLLLKFLREMPQKLKLRRL